MKAKLNKNLFLVANLDAVYNFNSTLKIELGARSFRQISRLVQSFVIAWIDIFFHNSKKNTWFSSRKPRKPNENDSKYIYPLATRTIISISPCRSLNIFYT